MLVINLAKDVTAKDQNESLNFNIIMYKQYFEVDPENEIFKSIQDISMTSSSEMKLTKVGFLLNPKLVIDKLDIIDKAQNVKITKSWDLGKFQVLSGRDRREVIIQTSREIVPDQKILLHIEYHIKPEEILKEKPVQLYDLIVNPHAMYAIGPFIGQNPIVNSILAPFKLTVKYPDKYLSCASGNLYEWFGEGGANFFACWATVKILGEKSASDIRLTYLRNFIGNRIQDIS